MNKRDLLKKLEILSTKKNEELLSGLEDRKLKELEFHNKDRDKNLTSRLSDEVYAKLHGNKKYYRTTHLSAQYVENWIKQHSKGTIFLDYACGNGSNAINAAKWGAELAIGIDISNVSIENARRSAENSNVSKGSYFIQGDCENTRLPENCIDACICSGMLHHLDLSYAFYELRRILKTGGVILAVEALAYNPLIKVYRTLTPQMRTEWEATHILSYKDLVFARRFFEVKEVKHWHLFSVAGVWLPFALLLLNRVDAVVLELPFLKLMSWMFTFELHKKK